MEEPIWVLEEVVLAIHRRQLAEHGGADGVRDLGLLQSALARPQQIFAYEPDDAALPRLAAAYGAGIARNHPFVDGNKRSAFVVSVLFLKLNGLRITASLEDRYTKFLALATGELSEAELAQWFASNSAPV